MNKSGHLRTVGAIENAIKISNVYISICAGTGNTLRVIDVRRVEDKLQVKVISGNWHEVSEFDTVYEQI